MSGPFAFAALSRASQGDPGGFLLLTEHWRPLKVEESRLSCTEHLGVMEKTTGRSGQLRCKTGRAALSCGLGVVCAGAEMCGLDVGVHIQKVKVEQAGFSWAGGAWEQPTVEKR